MCFRHRCYIKYLLLVHRFFYPHSHILFVICFACSNGPVAWAIVTWRNSLVFHDVDRMTSLFVHLLPPLVTFALRWYPVPLSDRYACPQELGGATFDAPPYLPSPVTMFQEESPDLIVLPKCNVSWTYILIVPMLIYELVWQFSYYLKTEFADRDKLKREPTIATSLRWLTKDSRSYIGRICLRSGM